MTIQQEAWQKRPDIEQVEFESSHDDGITCFVGIRNAFAFEALAGLIVWGLWELHYPVMVLLHAII